MSENTGIQWTDHTFNPWSGCTKISPGCANCYAAALPPSMRRNAEWGAGRDRVPASDAYWNEPVKWNRAAEKAGVRRRVFCASVADVFEDRASLDPWRDRLFNLIRATPWLDWQLLTKRPQVAVWWARGLTGDWPDNAWIGTSVENQDAANERVPWLVQLPAKVRFLSMEPMIGYVDVDRWLDDLSADVDGDGQTTERGIQWVIIGGESGNRARPFDPEWGRAVVRSCAWFGVPAFVKQMGSVWAAEHGAAHKKGGDPSEWPADLRVREMPS